MSGEIARGADHPTGLDTRAAIAGRTRARVSSHSLEERLSHFGRRGRHADSGGFESLNFGCGGAFAAADDRARVAHSPPGRSRGAGDKACHRLLAMLSNPVSRFLLRRAANFPDHDDAMGFRVRIEHLDDIEMGGAVDRISADADTSGLPDASAGELPHGFVGQRAAARNNSDVSALVDVARSDSDSTSALRI